MAMPFFVHTFQGPLYESLSGNNKSTITSFLSLGTMIGKSFRFRTFLIE